MKFTFISSHEKTYSIKHMCSVLGVKRSSYYAWRKRPMSQHEQEDRALLEQIRAIYEHSNHTYGSPRIHAFMRRRGYACGRNRIARLMHEYRIVAYRVHRRYPITTRQRRGAYAAPNLLRQDFTASKPNQKWVTDITYIDTREGWLYLAAILDLYSRRIVGWSMGDRIDTMLVQKALRMAIQNRKPAAGLVHHSDRGCQFTSQIYQDSLLSSEILASMSRSGNCYDNAAMESFFSTLKFECANKQFPTRAFARNTIFEFIEGWYNQFRLHSALNYLSPAEFETLSRH